VILFQVHNTPEEGYFDLIFNALKINKSIIEFGIEYHDGFKLNLKSEETLRFVESNSSIKELNFSFLSFSEIESQVLGESLMKNTSITKLDFSYSQYGGSFDFFQNNIIKTFFFCDIFQNGMNVDIGNFLKNLKLNQSLTNLDLSFNFGNAIDSIANMNELVNILGDHKGIIQLSLKNFSRAKIIIDFYKLLKNPNIIHLDLNSSFDFTKTQELEGFLNKMNENTTLKTLNLSENLMGSSTILDKIQISQNSIESLCISGEKRNPLKKVNWWEFSKNFKFFKRILNIPSLKKLDITSNTLGENGLEYLCQFIKKNMTMEELAFSGK
jgi:hypothetical protein